MTEPNCKTRYKWCDFVLKGEDETVQTEECKFCHRTVSYRKVNGKMDNNKYLRDHIRDFCQPTGPTARVYYEIYGEAHMQKRQHALDEHQARKDKIKDLDSEKDEYLKSALKGTVITLMSDKKNET